MTTLSGAKLAKIRDRHAKLRRVADDENASAQERESAARFASRLQEKNPEAFIVAAHGSRGASTAVPDAAYGHSAGWTPGQEQVPPPPPASDIAVRGWGDEPPAWAGHIAPEQDPWADPISAGCDYLGKH
jgi:hypothetical protein